MPRSLRSRSHLSPADKDIQAACRLSKRVVTRRSLGLQRPTPVDADQLPIEHASDRDGKDGNQEDEAPGIVDGGEFVSRPKTRARKLKEPPSQQESDHQQSKRQRIAHSGSAPSRKYMPWDTWFQRLEQYEKDNKHTRVPRNYVDASGSNLGRWVDTQRSTFARGRLSKERKQRLDSIDFEWKGLKGREQRESESWDTWFERLVEYKDEHENTRVPRKYVDTSTGSKLGIWVATQRQQYSREQLCDERIHRLESIGFKWSVRHQGDLTQRISLYCGIRTLREVDTSDLHAVFPEGRPWRCVSGEDESRAVGFVDGTVVSVPFDDDFVWF